MKKSLAQVMEEFEAEAKRLREGPEPWKQYELTMPVDCTPEELEATFGPGAQGVRL